MRLKARVASSLLVWAALSAFAFQITRAQSENAKAGVGARAGASGAVGASTDASDVAKTLKVAAETLGLARWSGVGGQRLPEVDVINTMEFWASGTTYGTGAPYKAGEPLPAFKTDYHAALGYDPPAVRLEITRTPVQGASAPQHAIQVVREKYAWDESEIGAGLVPGKGVATPAAGAASSRLLQLWILPYGVIKAAVAAGDKTKMTAENGSTVLTFPLSGSLTGVTVRATLDKENLVAKVETRTEDPALRNLIMEAEYSNYGDHGEIATDVKSPGHIIQKQGGHPVLDIQVKTWDANNPYLVFPVPESVKKSAAH